MLEHIIPLHNIQYVLRLQRFEIAKLMKLNKLTFLDLVHYLKPLQPEY